MYNNASYMRRSVVMIVAIMALAALAATPAAAQEICNENPTLALLDGDNDGAVSRGEIQAFIDSAGDAEGIDELQALVDQMSAGASIRYVDCEGGGSGTGNGSGEGTDTGDGSGSGSGTGDGSGDGSGTGDGGDTADSGSGESTASTGDDGTGTTAVDPVTGLPITGHGPGLANSLPAQLVILIVTAAIAGIALRTGLRQRA